MSKKGIFLTTCDSQVTVIAMCFGMAYAKS